MPLIPRSASKRASVIEPLKGVIVKLQEGLQKGRAKPSNPPAAFAPVLDGDDIATVFQVQENVASRFEAIESKLGEQGKAIAGLEAKHGEDMKGLEARHAENMKESETRHKESEARYREDMKGLEARHAENMKESETRHKESEARYREDMKDMEARHTFQLELVMKKLEMIEQKSANSEKENKVSPTQGHGLFDRRHSESSPDSPRRSPSPNRPGSPH